MITIIDYKAGNIASIQNMLKKVGIASKISSDPATISSSASLILPGVGHFDYGMKNLMELGLKDAIINAVKEKKARLLGICLGAQLLGLHSEEGNKEGLGLVNMNVSHFDRNKLSNSQKIPHMGWNEVIYKKKYREYQRFDHENDRFYFVHSYHFDVFDTDHIFCTSKYGYEFVSGVINNKVLGVQFHPEKSHSFGLHFLKTHFKNLECIE